MEKKRIVVKVGTSTLTYATGHLNLRRIESLVRVMADIKNAGNELIFVTSGAVGVGVAKLGLPGRPADMPGKQAAAAVGQCELMYLYDKLFSQYHHHTAQILLTRDIIEENKKKENVINTFEKLLGLGAIPIVNENDTIATEEIEIGDNDTLSAIVAALVKADLLIILSDIDGLYDSDPRKNPGAKLIDTVKEITPQIKEMATGAGSEFGTGGMSTKINAAEIASAHKFNMMIVNGDNPEILYDAVEEKKVGTLFQMR